MAIIWADQPYFYTTATMSQRWTATGGANLSVSTATTPRSGTACIRVSSGSGGVSKTLGSDGGGTPSGSKFIIGVRYRNTSVATSGGGGAPLIIQANTSGTAQACVTLNTDGTLSVRRGGNTGTILGTTTYALSSSIFYYIELMVTIHASAGTVDLYVDSDNKLSLTGVNTANSGTAWNGFSLENSGNGIASVRDFTDIYVCDGTDGTATQGAAYNTALGDVKVDYLAAQAGNGTNTGFTCSTGSDHGANVDDAGSGPDGDTTYNYASAAGTKDTYNLANLVSTAVSVKAILPVYSVTKDDSGSKTIAPVYRTGGSDFDGTTINSPSMGTYTILTEVKALNPNTSAAWTPTEVNALEAGLKVVS